MPPVPLLHGMIVFFFLGLSISFFLFLLIIIKKDKSAADRVLGAWMFFMTLHIGLFILDFNEISYQYPHLLGIILPLPILHGFFLYWYTSQTTGKSISASSVMWHLIPFILLVTLAVPFYMLPGSEKLYVFRNAGKGFEWYSLIQNILFVIVGLSYSIASIVRIKKYRKKVLNTFSNTENGTLLWLEYISYGFAAVWLVAYPTPEQYLFTGVAFFVLFIGAFGINRTDVFIPSIQKIEPETNPEKYQKSGLADSEAIKLSDQLKAFMEKNKPYKNADLTLDELATMVQMNSNQLSQVINGQEGKTFYHYINSYRIREFLVLSSYADSRKFTYAGLANECGFQSKTTFNKYFKMETGKTPSEYFLTTSAEIAVA